MERRDCGRVTVKFLRRTGFTLVFSYSLVIHPFINPPNIILVLIVYTFNNEHQAPAILGAKDKVKTIDSLHLWNLKPRQIAVHHGRRQKLEF